MSDDFLRSWEGLVLTEMLAADFPGASELRTQARTARVHVTRADVPRVVFEVDPQATPAEVRYRIPVEAAIGEEGDACVHCLLHVVRGRLDELQFYREDGQPISNRSSLADTRIIVPP